MKPIPALLEGARTTLRCRHIVILSWLVTLAFALVIVAPAMTLAFGSLGHSMYPDRMRGGFELQWIAELLFHSHSDVLALFTPLAALVLAGHFLITVFLTGGMIAVVQVPGLSFFASCARNFPRMCRITAIALGSYALLLGACMGAQSLASGFEEERQVVIVKWIVGGAALLVFLALNMVFDYAKIFAVAGAGQPVRSAFLFVRHNRGRTTATYASVLLIVALLTLAYTGLSGAGVPALALVLQQVYLLTRSGVRMLFYASQVNVWR